MILVSTFLTLPLINIINYFYDTIYLILGLLYINNVKIVIYLSIISINYYYIKDNNVCGYKNLLVSQEIVKLLLDNISIISYFYIIELFSSKKKVKNYYFYY